MRIIGLTWPKLIYFHQLGKWVHAHEIPTAEDILSSIPYTPDSTRNFDKLRASAQTCTHMHAILFICTHFYSSARTCTHLHLPATRKSWCPEKLQLLAHFLYSDVDSGAGYQTNKHLATNHDIRLLNTVAIALTTGEPGDVYAAAFDKKNHFALVLAKNGPVVSKDIVAADNLLTLLRSATSSKEFCPFLFGRCKLNIEKRINNVRNTMGVFLGLVDDMLASY